MSMLTEEVRNFSFEGWLNILSSGSRDTAPDNFAWFEELFSIQTIVVPRQIWGDFSSIPPAPDLATAQANAAAAPTIIADYSLAANAIHCTPSPNGKVFFATSVYNDLSTRMYNWILPQLIPRTDVPFVGYPSIGYMVRFWQGDPNAGGTEIATTQDQIGARPGWFFHFGTGCIVIASNFSAVSDPTDIWITGFRYVGAQGGGGAVTPGGGDMAIQYNSGGALGGNAANFYWNYTTQQMAIGHNVPDASAGLHIKKGAEFSAYGVVIENSFAVAGLSDIWLRASGNDLHLWYNGTVGYINADGSLSLGQNGANRINLYSFGAINFSPLAGQTINVNGTIDYEKSVLGDDDIPNKKYVDSPWKYIASFTRTSDSTFTVTDDSTNQAIFTPGRPIRYRATAGTWRYGKVTNYTTGTVTIAGYPMTTSDDDELQFGLKALLSKIAFSINGEFADGIDGTLLLNDLGVYRQWSEGEAYCIMIAHRVIVQDTGANQPRVNVRIAGAPVCSSNSNQGRDVSTSWVSTVVDISGAYALASGNAIELSTDANGSNNDATGLSIELDIVKAEL